MSHRGPATADTPPWWRRWWPRRRQQVHLPDYLWPLVVRTAQTQRMTPEQWVQHVVAGCASAHVLGQQPPRDGQADHPHRWREVLKMMNRAADAHWQLVRQGVVNDMDGRFTAVDSQQVRREHAARPGRPRPRVVGRPTGQ